MDVNTYKAIATGQRSKAAGELFEKIIERSCEYYGEYGEAEITKTPEPMRPIRRLKGGQFIAVFTKKAQPDYKGTLKDGRSIVFEAKHTDTGKIQRSVITEEQEKQLNRHEKLGATCFVLLSFGFERFYRVPWTYFRDMDRYVKRKYLVPDDLKEAELPYVNGILHFLWEQ